MDNEVIYESLAPEGAWEDPEFLLILAAERVSAQIAIAMDEQGVSQAELARRLGVSRQHISAFLADPGNPTLKTMVDMAHALGLRVNVELAPAEESEDEAPEAEEASERTPAEA
ncbi:MAG: helix-turn-helix transcriptional regulator [Armatimonadota bacterium]